MYHPGFDLGVTTAVVSTIDPIFSRRALTAESGSHKMRTATRA